MTTTTTLADLIGRRVRFDLENGDSYYGVVDHVAGQQVTVRDYSVWYDDAPAPYNSPYADDTATFCVTLKASASV